MRLERMHDALHSEGSNTTILLSQPSTTRFKPSLDCDTP